MTNPAANSRELYLWARITNPILYFKSPSLFITPVFRLCSFLNSLSIPTEEKPTVGSTVRGKRSKLPITQGESQLSELCGVPPAWGWWSLGPVHNEGLILEMFWLDHELGLGKHCLRFTGRNEAEFTTWCFKTLTFAKCLSNPSHLHIEPRAMTCFTVSPAEITKVSPLHLFICYSDKDRDHPRPLLARCPKPGISRITGPISGGREESVSDDGQVRTCVFHYLVALGDAV